MNEPLYRCRGMTRKGARLWFDFDGVDAVKRAETFTKAAIEWGVHDVLLNVLRGRTAHVIIGCGHVGSFDRLESMTLDIGADVAAVRQWRTRDSCTLRVSRREGEENVLTVRRVDDPSTCVSHSDIIAYALAWDATSPRGPSDPVALLTGFGYDHSDIVVALRDMPDILEYQEGAKPDRVNNN